MPINATQHAPKTQQAAPPADRILEVREISVTYSARGRPGKVAIENVSFDVRRGEFLAIVGPSGAGKSTLLRCIAGLMHPTAGSVVLNGEQISRPPRALAMVFQEYGRSLLPWFTNEQNVALPLRNLGVSRREAAQRSREAMLAVAIDESAWRQYPWQLSGGMQQRIAIARAIAYDADLLVMDEPFASVDAQTRLELEDLMLSLQAERGLTVLFVTHDIDEAIYLSDRIVVLSRTPARVARLVEPGLARPRDQVFTKADPQYANARAEVLSLVMPQRGEQSS